MKQTLRLFVAGGLLIITISLMIIASNININPTTTSVTIKLNDSIVFNGINDWSIINEANQCLLNNKSYEVALAPGDANNSITLVINKNTYMTIESQVIHGDLIIIKDNKAYLNQNAYKHIPRIEKTEIKSPIYLKTNDKKQLLEVGTTITFKNINYKVTTNGLESPGRMKYSFKHLIRLKNKNINKIISDVRQFNQIVPDHEIIERTMVYYGTVEYDSIYGLKCTNAKSNEIDINKLISSVVEYQDSSK